MCLIFIVGKVFENFTIFKVVLINSLLGMHKDSQIPILGLKFDARFVLSLSGFIRRSFFWKLHGV